MGWVWTQDSNGDLVFSVDGSGVAFLWRRLEAMGLALGGLGGAVLGLQEGESDRDWGAERQEFVKTLLAWSVPDEFLADIIISKK